MPITDNIDDIKRIDDIEVEAYSDNSIRTVSSSTVVNQDSLSIDSFAIKKDTANHTYTGTGLSNSLVTGIGSGDLTQGIVDANGDTILHDRATGDCVIKVNGVIQESGSIAFAPDAGITCNHFKNRDVAYGHKIFSGILGVGKAIDYSTTGAEGSFSTGVTSYNSNGVTVGTLVDVNGSTNRVILHQTNYTHGIWGLTNHNKRYICAYNPVTMKVLYMYEGSGLAGHRIPNPLGKKLNYIDTKSLDQSTYNWQSNDGTDGKMLALNTTSGYLTLDYISLSNKEYVLLTGSSVATPNNNNEVYIAQGFANSDYKEIIQAQTSSSTDTPIYDRNGKYLFTVDSSFGNQTYLFIVEKDSGKLSSMVYKAVSTTGNWVYKDYVRGFDNYITLNTSNIEASHTTTFNHLEATTDPTFNQVTDGSNLNLASTVFTYSNGYGANGIVKSSEQVTGTIDFAGVSDGWKWFAKEEGGSYSFYDEKPSYGMYEKTHANDNRLVFKDGKFWTTTGGAIYENDGTDVTGWTLINGDETLTSESGMLKMAQGATDNGGMYKSIVTEIGKEYSFNFTTSYGTSTIHEFLIDGVLKYIGIGNVTIKFTATSVLTEIRFRLSNSTTGLYGYWDNISVYKLEPTLSTALTTPLSFSRKPVLVANETPQVFGTDELSLEYVESLSVGRLEITGNRKIIELGTIFNNNRYVIDWNDVDLPVTSYNYIDCDVKAELYVNGIWSETGIGNSMGVNQYAGGTGGFATPEGIVVQTGQDVVYGKSNKTINAFNTSVDGATSAPCRVIVTYVGVAK